MSDMALLRIGILVAGVLLVAAIFFFSRPKRLAQGKRKEPAGAEQPRREPVLGGAAMVMFGAVAASGINILASTHLDRRALLIIAVSLALGLGVSQVPEFLAHMPAALRDVLESGVATGGICALVLNWFLPETEKKPAL